MNPRTFQQASHAILYDADCLEQPDRESFEPESWRSMGRIRGEAIGRGSAWFIDAPFGAVVLRRYLRGGQAARLSRDRYFFRSFENSRPFQEFRVMQKLWEDGLPVPPPVAALCDRSGLFYRGALMTRRLENALPLADLMTQRMGDEDLWQQCGATIRQFHEKGLVHADLNARNILVQHDSIYLIDFDRAHFSPGDEKAFKANLDRLHRSFRKLWPLDYKFRMPDCWQAVLRGYQEQ